MCSVVSLERLDPRTHRWLARLAAGVMAGILSLPAVADARPLEQLLRMPLEQLLQLQITEPWAALPAGPTYRRDDVIAGSAR